MNGAIVAFRIVVEMDPGRLAVNRAWRAVKRRDGSLGVAKSARYRTARAEFGEAVMLKAAAEGLKPLTGPLSATVVAFWPRTHREGPALGTAVGDVDAPLKGVLDGLEDGGIFADDAQVVQARIEKRIDPHHPRIVVWVYRLGD